MLRVRDWIMIGVVASSVALGTVLGLVRAHQNAGEIQEGVRLAQATKELQKASSERVRLSLMQTLLQRPGDLRARAAEELGLRSILPQDIVTLTRADTTEGR
jgi:hypothetical protein